MEWTGVDDSRQLVGVLGLPLEIATTLYGGSAEVHKYWEPALERYVVGKRLLLLDRPIIGELHEPQLQHRLKHEHLVPVITVSDILDTSSHPPRRLDDEVEVVTPFYERGSAFDAIARGEDFDVCEVLDIMRAAALGLAELHGEGYVHRDFKSPNLFLSDDGSIARVGDLGEAHPLDAAGRAPGLDSPTPWIAPEQVAADVATVASDLFGVGVTLVELLQGGLDLRGYTREKGRERMARGLPPLPRAKLRPPPTTPPAVRALVNRLTDARPEQRTPDTAAAVADRLATAPAIGWRKVPGEFRWEGRSRGDGREYAVEFVRRPRRGDWEVATLRRGSSGWRAVQRDNVPVMTGQALQAVLDQAVRSAT